MKTFNVRAMVEGAIFASITVIMGIFYRVPVLEVLTFFWPVPIILIGYRHGFKVSLVSTLVAAAIIALVVNPLVGLTLLMVYALPGSVIGMMLHKKKSPYMAILAGGILLAISAVLEFALMLHVLTGKNLIDIAMNFGPEVDRYYSYIYDAVVKATSIYQNVGIDPQTINQSLEVFKSSVSMAKLLLPVSFVMIGILIAYMNFKVVRAILSRMGYAIEDIKPFHTWRIKDSWVAPTFILTAAILLVNYLKVSWMQAVSLNLFLALSLTFGILGASVAAFFIKKLGATYEIPKGLQSVILVVLCITLYPVLPFIGMFDLTADIRRLNRNTIGGIK